MPGGRTVSDELGVERFAQAGCTCLSAQLILRDSFQACSVWHRLSQLRLMRCLQPHQLGLCGSVRLELSSTNKLYSQATREAGDLQLCGSVGHELSGTSRRYSQAVLGLGTHHGSGRTL